MTNPETRNDDPAAIDARLDADRHAACSRCRRSAYRNVRRVSDFHELSRRADQARIAGGLRGRPPVDEVTPVSLSPRRCAMKKNEVKIGGVYTAKVTNKLVEVRIDAREPPRRLGRDEPGHGQEDPHQVARSGCGRRRRRRAAGEGRGAEGQGRRRGRGARRRRRSAADAGQRRRPRRRTPSRSAAKAEARAKEEPKPKRMSGLDAAAKVLEESGQPMTAKEMVEAAEAKGYWKSPGGKTPHATVYSAIIREIATKGGEARFRKAERGQVRPRLNATSPQFSLLFQPRVSARGSLRPLLAPGRFRAISPAQ